MIIKKWGTTIFEVLQKAYWHFWSSHNDCGFKWRFFFFQSNSKEKLVFNLEAKDVINVKCFLCSFEFSDVASIATTPRNDEMIFEPIQKVIYIFFQMPLKWKSKLKCAKKIFELLFFQNFPNYLFPKKKAIYDQILFIFYTFVKFHKHKNGWCTTDSGVPILPISFLFEEVVQQVSYLVQPWNKHIF
jgi:hypothetical protein